MEYAGHAVHCGDSTKVQRSLAGDGRAQSATMGGRGSARVGLGRGNGRGAGYGSVTYDHFGRTWGTGVAREAAIGRRDASTPAGRRPQDAYRNRPRIARRLGSADRTCHARGSGISVALDVQEHASFGRRVDSEASSHWRQHRRRVAPPWRIQSSGQPQDSGGRPPSRSQCPVRAHQRASAAISASGSTGDLSGHQKEGIDRGFQERRARMAASRRAGRGPCSRLPRQEPGQGHPLRGVRHDQQSGMGERGHRSRHGAIRSQQHPPVVETDGTATVSPGYRTADHGRRRREQQLALSPVEGIAASAGRPVGPMPACLPLPAGDEQVEQDRASTFQLHHPELAWTPPAEPSDRCQSDRRHDHTKWTHRQGSLGHQPLRNRCQGHRRTTESTPIDTTPIPWRLELPTHATQEKMTRLFLIAP